MGQASRGVGLVVRGGAMANVSQPSQELKVEVTVLIGVGLIAAVCTAKITTLINRNTKSVLQAIADLQRG